MKSYLTSLIIRKIQIKVSYYLIPVTMAIIKKTRDGKCWQECGEKGTLVYCDQDCKSHGAVTMENNMNLPQKIKNRTTYDPAITLLGIYLKDIKTGYWRYNISVLPCSL